MYQAIIKKYYINENMKTADVLIDAAEQTRINDCDLTQAMRIVEILSETFQLKIRPGKKGVVIVELASRLRKSFPKQACVA